ncbi:hypothetical protein LXA43DRAFT_1019688 [Ganoderma leucocontextum]|nr:hypothetical protein LXA43DRAFT_1019688 [Ganoderma leucocontextum]
MAQPQPITQAQLDFFDPNVPLPQGSPVLATPGDPVDSGLWENEVLTTKYLSTVGGPFHMDDATRALLHTRVIMFKVRIAELTRLRQRLQWPSEIISRELAGHLWKHRFLTRALFRICELPDEVLGIIFTYVVYSSPITTMKQYHATRNVLTSTCRRFRSVALEHRTLWSMVFFTDRAPWELSFRALSQAGTAPLTVGFGVNPNFTLHHGCKPLKAGEINAILAGLAPSVPHLQGVTAIIDDNAMAKFCRWLTPAGPHASPLETLQTLRLHFAPEDGATGQPTAGPSTTLFNEHSMVPNLSTIVLDGIRIDWDNQSPRVFGNVRELILLSGSRPLPNIPSAKWSQILSCAAATLVRLDLRRVWVDDEDDESPPPTRVELPNILELTISYDHSDAQGTEFTLAHMHMPRLACLNIESTLPRRTNFSRLLGETYGHFPQLRVLSLRFVLCEGTPRPEPVRNDYFLEFGRWLRAMPRLKVLKLGWTYNAVQAFLRPLAMPELYLDGQEMKQLRSKKKKNQGPAFTPPLCCPELDTIAISWNEGDPTLDLDDFRLLLMARQQLGKPYSHLEVYVGGSPSAPAKLLAGLNERGISELVGRFELVRYPTVLKAEKEARRESGLGFTLFNV